jgi:hypothetical protein
VPPAWDNKRTTLWILPVLRAVEHCTANGPINPRLS